MAKIVLTSVDAQEAEVDSESLVVLRQTVLTRDKKMAGYEFFQPEEDGTGHADPKHERFF